MNESTTMEANAKTYEPGGDSALRLAACCGPLSSPRGHVKPPRLSPWKLAPPTGPRPRARPPTRVLLDLAATWYERGSRVG